jgi:hypothetical protein
MDGRERMKDRGGRERKKERCGARVQSYGTGSGFGQREGFFFVVVDFFFCFWERWDERGGRKG